MDKQEFLAALRQGLSGMPQEEIDERVTFYREMIEDKVEEGQAEKEAVAEFGAVDKIVMQIKSEQPLRTLVRERVKPSRALRVWEIILLAIGSPIWLSLLLAACAVIFAVFVVLWSVVVVLWAVAAALMASAISGLLAGVVFIVQGNVPEGIAMLGAALVCAGITVLAAFGCAYATTGILLLTKKIFRSIKCCFVRKESLK